MRTSALARTSGDAISPKPICQRTACLSRTSCFLESAISALSRYVLIGRKSWRAHEKSSRTGRRGLGQGSPQTDPLPNQRCKREQSGQFTPGRRQSPRDCSDSNSEEKQIGNRVRLPCTEGSDGDLSPREEHRQQKYAACHRHKMFASTRIGEGPRTLRKRLGGAGACGIPVAARGAFPSRFGRVPVRGQVVLAAGIVANARSLSMSSCSAIERRLPPNGV
jgi:hypothetical protein